MQPGERVGHYRIIEGLGEGGIGEVYRACDEELERDVAIKRLRPELLSRPKLAARFHAEARTLAQLSHPHIATVHALERHEGALCMVMEYVEGETFASLLRARGPLSSERAIPLFLQSLDALGYAHERGVIHRDIKGSNLMLSADGQVKLMDFGIARIVGEERVTRIGQMIGTPEFMAPEQVRGEDADARSDLYAVGILLFAILTGRAPFTARSDFDTLRAQVESTPPSLRDLSPDAAAGLEAVLRRALEKDPQQRFQSAPEFREALASLIDAGVPSALAWPWSESTANSELVSEALSESGEAITPLARPRRTREALPLIEAELLETPLGAERTLEIDTPEEPAAARTATPTDSDPSHPQHRLAALASWAAPPAWMRGSGATAGAVAALSLLALDLIWVAPAPIAAETASHGARTSVANAHSAEGEAALSLTTPETTRGSRDNPPPPGAMPEGAGRQAQIALSSSSGPLSASEDAPNAVAAELPLPRVPPVAAEKRAQAPSPFRSERSTAAKQSGEQSARRAPAPTKRRPPVARPRAKAAAAKEAKQGENDRWVIRRN